jgi:hypothetical protein
MRILAFVLLLIAAPCRGAEISCAYYSPQHQDRCEAGFLKGEIVKGDYERLSSFYRYNHPFLSRFALQSPGGDVEEAIKIGRLFRKYSLGAIAPKRGQDSGGFRGSLSVGSCSRFSGECGCICASSCALIWFGAPRRLGQVGLHRPVIQDSAFKDLVPAKAEEAYKSALMLINSYLEEMEIPKAFADAMVSTSSAEIHWTTIEDYKALEVSPSFDEWIEANCGKYESKAEINISTELTIKRKDKNISAPEEYLQGVLAEKAEQRYSCIGDLILSNRRKTEPPPASFSFNNMFNNIFESQPKKDAESNCTRMPLYFVRPLALF